MRNFGTIALLASCIAMLGVVGAETTTAGVTATVTESGIISAAAVTSWNLVVGSAASNSANAIVTVTTNADSWSVGAVASPAALTSTASVPLGSNLVITAPANAVGIAPVSAQECTFNFKQAVASGDAPGTYSTTVTYTLAY